MEGVVQHGPPSSQSSVQPLPNNVVVPPASSPMVIPPHLIPPSSMPAPPPAMFPSAPQPPTLTHIPTTSAPSSFLDPVANPVPSTALHDTESKQVKEVSEPMENNTRLVICICEFSQYSFQLHGQYVS